MDPVTLLAGAAWLPVALALLFVLPGLTLGRLLAPGAMTPADRLGRAAGLSLIVVGAAGALLAALGLLRPTILIATLVGLTILPLHARLPRRPGIRRGRARRWWLGAIVAGTVAAGFLALPGLLAGIAGGGLAARDWLDVNAAVAIANTGGTAAEVPVWGTVDVLPAEHLLATHHLAAALTVLPFDLPARLEAVRLAVLGAALLGGTMLFRRWVSSLLALLGASLLVAAVPVSLAFAGWEPLGWALAVAPFGLWAMDRALVERSRRLALTAAVAGGAVLAADAAAFLLWLAMGAGLVVARIVVAPGGGPDAAGGLGHRHGRRLGIRRRYAFRTFRPLGWALAAMVAAVILGFGAQLALGGRLAVLDWLTGRTVGSGEVLARIAELPEGWRFSDDPTWDFERAATGVALDDPEPAPPSTPNPPIAVIWPRIDAAAPAGLAVVVLLAGATGLAWLVGDQRRQRAIVAAVVLAAALWGLALIVDAAAVSHAGRSSAATRVLPAHLALVIAAVVALWLAGGRLVARWGSRTRGATRPAAAAVLAVAGGLLAAPAQVPAEPALTGLGRETYAWLGEHLRDDARLVTGAWTPGLAVALSGRATLTDGPDYAPTQPSWPVQATARLLGARRLLADPTGPGAAAYLEREAVSHLLVAGPGGTLRDLGGGPLFDVDIEGLRTSDRFRLAATFGAGELLLFEVTGR